MSGVVDFHTHAFPDRVAAKAIPLLEQEGDVKAYLDGTVAALLQSMDKAGIEQAVICSIATRAEQFQPILDWSAAIRSSRLIPFPSIHPDDPKMEERLQAVAEKGFKGIKLHPYYQDFYLTEEKMDQLYESVCQLGLLLVVHTGYDIAFPQIRRADPEQILQVVTKHPKLKLITTHLGAWDQWDEVEKLLVGKPIYMELSFSPDFLDQKRIKTIITNHPPEYILFGTDSPWADQTTTLKMLQKIGLDQRTYDRVVCKNASALLTI